MNRLAATVLCGVVMGCERTSRESLDGGYEKVTRALHSWEPTLSRTELWYVDPEGKRTLIWPETLSVMVKDGVAVFLAGKAYDPPLPDEPKATCFRLFAVRGPGLAMEITDEVVARWAAASGKDVGAAVTNATIIGLRPEAGDPSLYVGFQTPTWADAPVTLGWEQVSNIMQEVKAKGVVRKDPVWRTSYLEKTFDAKSR